VKLRTPPFGRRILDERRAGHHPNGVNVHLGGWPEHARGRTRTMWVPEDAAPGTYDWRVCAGLSVMLWDFRSFKPGPQSLVALGALAGELADHAMSLWVVTRRETLTVLELAAQVQAAQPSPVPWWPDERARRYIEREQRWREALLDDLARRRCLGANGGNEPGLAPGDQVGGRPLAGDRGAG
jgi:hypothetical protein